MESSGNSNWLRVVLLSLLAIINWNFNSLEIFSGVRCEMGFSFVLSPSCPNTVYSITHHVLIKKPPAGMCWPQGSGGIPFTKLWAGGEAAPKLPAHHLTPDCVTTSFLRRVQTQDRLSLPYSFPAHREHHMGSVFPQTLPSLCSLGPVRLLFPLTTLSHRPLSLLSPRPHSP